MDIVPHQAPTLSSSARAAGHKAVPIPPGLPLGHLTDLPLRLDPDLHRLGTCAAVRHPRPHHHAAQLHVVRRPHLALTAALQHHTHQVTGRNTSSRPSRQQPPKSRPERSSRRPPRASTSATPSSRPSSTRLWPQPSTLSSSPSP